MIYIEGHKIIDEVEKKRCTECKKWLELDCFHNHKLTYDFLTKKCKNCSVKRGRPSGYVMSKKSKQKVAEALKGRTLSRKHRENLSKSMMGNKNGKTKKMRTQNERIKEDFIAKLKELLLEYGTFTSLEAELDLTEKEPSQQCSLVFSGDADEPFEIDLGVHVSAWEE